MNTSSLRHFGQSNFNIKNHDIDERLEKLFGENHEKDIILYCEDDETIRKAMVNTLKFLFPNKVIADMQNAEDAIQMLTADIETRNKIAFVLSDFNLSKDGKTGGDLVKHLRSIKSLQNIPFILNSGNRSLEESDYYGLVDDFLYKPGGINALKDSLRNAIKRRILSVLSTH